MSGSDVSVIEEADALIQDLLREARSERKADVDFRLQVMQTATRWVGVKNRVVVSDEGNAFDGFRSSIAGAASATRPAGQPAPAASAPARQREGAPGATASARPNGSANAGPAPAPATTRRLSSIAGH